MRLSQPRLQPLSDGDLDEDASDFLKQVERDGRVLNIYRTLAAHPKLLGPSFGTHVLYQNSLPARERNC